MEPWSDKILTEFTLSVPSRLHFGLYSIGGIERFGGMGLMIDDPAVVIRCRKFHCFQITGPHSKIVSDIVERVCQSQVLPQDPTTLPIQIELVQTPPRHSGLGSGTQIGFGVAATLMHCFKLPSPSAAEMARLLDRGKRSAIGSYGFFFGGCIADSGIKVNSDFSPIETRIEFPNDWPIVLIRPQEKSGLHGQNEKSAFERLVGSESKNRQRLKKLCHEQIIPGIQAHNYGRFAHALHTFNRTSGEYFSDFQSGAYNSPQCAQIVQSVLDFGIPAVGQSSWGPTLFAVAPSKKLAEDLVNHLRKHCLAVGDETTSQITITQANNRGVQIVQDVEVNRHGGSALTG